MRSLFLIGRHGETFLNENGCYRGLSNGPDAQLNEDGRQSAHDLGKFLASLGQKFSKIICSPLNRAQLTAAIVAGYVGVEKIQLDDRLLPLNVGSLAGQPKDKNPIHPYLKDKNKRFPDGETINEFEAREHSFAIDLLDTIESTKQDDDVEVLVLAHVSNIMYWVNVQSGKTSDEYLDESSDIVIPGGAVMVTEHAVVPIFRANEQAAGEGEGIDLINSKSVKGEPGTGFEKRGGSGPFECGNCAYFKNGNACHQKDMMAKSKQPRHSDGSVIVDGPDCCEYVERPTKK